jgi:hypothetical protein
LGDVLEIDLGDGWHSYARVSTDPLVLFYDLKTKDSIDIEEIVRLPIAFRIWVMNDDLRSGTWKKIGCLPLELEDQKKPVTFKQDSITGALSLYHSEFPEPGFERAATVSQCAGLERAAVWSAKHAVDRLQDHFRGTANRWVSQLAIDLDKVPIDQRDDLKS